MGNPQIQMRRLIRCNLYGNFTNLAKGEGFITIEPLMLGGHLARTIIKLPRRIGENCPKLLIPGTLNKILDNIHLFFLRVKFLCYAYYDDWTSRPASTFDSRQQLRHMRCRLPVGFPATETVEDFLQF